MWVSLHIRYLRILCKLTFVFVSSYWRHRKLNKLMLCSKITEAEFCAKLEMKMWQFFAKSSNVLSSADFVCSISLASQINGRSDNDSICIESCMFSLMNVQNVSGLPLLQSHQSYDVGMMHFVLPGIHLQLHFMSNNFCWRRRRRVAPSTLRVINRWCIVLIRRAAQEPTFSHTSACLL